MKLFLLLIVSLLSFTSYSQSIEADRAALVKLYNGTNGPQWKNQNNWNTTTSPCGWYGITCSDGRVTEIRLAGNNLAGTIPIEKEDFTELRWLELPDNHLTGNIPAELGSLSNLTDIYLGANKLTSEISPKLTNLRNLRALSLYDNQLTGSIPDALYNGSKLILLDLAQNKLTGGISSAIGNAKLLQGINLWGNQFTGPLPDSLWELSDLNYLALHDNNLSGEISAGIGKLTNLNLLFLNNNQFAGFVPEEIGNLSQLTHLNLSHNGLHNENPGLFGNLTNLEVLDLSHNSFFKIFENLGNLTKLKTLNLNNNYLWAIPSDIGNLLDLEYLNLSSDSLFGPIPSSILNLTKLKRLELDNNELKGTVPDFRNIADDGFISLSLNNFTFSGLESNTEKFDNYSPQRNLPLNLKDKTLSVEAGGNLLNNTYVWYNNNEQVASDKGINSYSMTGSGSYRVEIYNDLVPGLVLNSKVFVFDENRYLTLIVNGKKLSVDPRNNLQYNHYMWYKDNQLLSVTNTNEFTMNGDGAYRVEVYNYSLPGRFAYSNTYVHTENPLLVTLINFSAKKSEKGNQISWSTTSETNNAGFEIERSADAKSFVMISRIDGKGNSSVLNHYEFFDQSPLGNGYYRLKQIDHNGKSAFSRTVYVQYVLAALKVYPNPAHGNFVLESTDADSPVYVYNLNGQKVMKRKGSNFHTFKTDGLTNGIYVIQQGSQRIKLAIEK
ncbi:T9SS type A sorting domain-containing protein [Dyadobacter sp. NIV53]|uniref:leucine-rich repeat domain-containing protein n=1 Tax=Dyadobacter sp. NIV53 TaxID=2861765 RepID=UPI001C889FC9|nr:T9SS type A sorting domain-containing protein [Dyadobacter sp. NIV53]